MAFFIIPKCPKCKSQKNVETESAWTKLKTRVLVTYCRKCMLVISCEMSAMLKEDSH